LLSAAKFSTALLSAALFSAALLSVFHNCEGVILYNFNSEIKLYKLRLGIVFALYNIGD